MFGKNAQPFRAQALAAVLFLLLAAAASAGEAELAHAIFVKVNGRTITQEQVLDAVRFIVHREYDDVMPVDEMELETIQEAALRDLVRTYLIHDAVEQYPEIRPTADMYKRAERNSGMAPERITPTIRRMLVADDLFTNLMMMEGTPVSEPSPREVKEFYAKNRDEFRPSGTIIVRTIFIPLDGRRPQAYFRAQGEELMNTLRSVPVAQRTEAFANAARQYSQDVFAEFGGLLTADSPDRWISSTFPNRNAEGEPIFPETMAVEIRRLSRAGEIRIAVSDDGVHLVYCEDIRHGRELSWAEAKRIIDYVLTEQLRNERLRWWINRIYEQSDVRWHDGAPFEKDTLTKILLPSERNGMRNELD